MADFLQLGTSLLPKAPVVRSKCKLNVYTLEPNVTMGAYRYLPYSTGLLRAYAESDAEIRANYRFMPFLYEMDTVKNLLAKFTEEPDVLAVSVSMWNEQLNLAVAREVKKRWPGCLTIFGGCHVPHHPSQYMEQHQFIDVCVRSEGEEAFRDVLIRYISSGDFVGIPDVTFRGKYRIIENSEHRPSSKDLDCYPSPYMLGLYDDLMASRKEGSRMFQAIIETNRGCPFDCSFLLLGGRRVNDEVSVS